MTGLGAGMAMGGAIIYLSALIVLAQNALLFLDAGFEPGWPPAERIKFAMVVVNDLSILGSSLLGAIWFFGRGIRGWGTLLAGNLLILVVAVAVRTRGWQFRPWAFAAVDLYWLQLYLGLLIVHFRRLRAGLPAPTTPPATSSKGSEEDG